MPGKTWNDTIKTLNRGIDSCKATVDSLTSKSSNCQEIYHSPNTIVEVNIKRAKRRSPTTAPHSKVTRMKKRIPNNYEGKSSRRKIYYKDEMDGSFLKNETHRKKSTFHQRILRVFCKEMKSLLLSSGIESALELLDDIEYLALDLGDERTKDVIEESKEKHVDKYGGVRRVEMKELERKYQSEMAQVTKLKNELHEKNSSIKEYKTLIRRLTSNNEEMTRIIQDKLEGEDKISSLSQVNRKLQDALSFERNKVSEMEKVVFQSNGEIERLQRIIQDLRITLSHDLEELENSKKNSPPKDDFSFLSSRSESSDSAIDPGVSESLPITLSKSSTKNEESPNEIPERDFGNDYLESLSLKMDSKVSEFLKRMRRQAQLDFSLPLQQQLGNRKTFTEPSIQIDLSSGSEWTSSDSKLEEPSLFLSSSEMSSSSSA